MAKKDSNRNQPNRLYSPTHRYAWRGMGAKLHFVGFHPEAPVFALWGRPHSSTQARLTVPKPSCGPELLLPRPGIQEAPEGPDEWQLPNNTSLCFLQGGRGSCDAVLQHLLGLPKGETRFWLSIRNSSVLSEQTFSPLTNTNSDDGSCFLFALVA